MLSKRAFSMRWTRACRRRLVWLAVLLSFLGAGLYFAQVFEEILASTTCESEGIYYVQLALQAYAGEHGGQLPPEPALRSWAAQHADAIWTTLPSRCNKGTFVWAREMGSVARAPFGAVVWCGGAHGLWRRWRNVIFDDLSLRRVPEGEMQALLRGQPATSPAMYRPVYRRGTSNAMGPRLAP